jgi:hypothetical protein
MPIRARRAFVSRTKTREIPVRTPELLDDVPRVPDVKPAVTSLPKPPASTAVGEDRIRELAYYKWEAAGCPPGDGVSFWLEAETELMNVAQTED